LPDFSAGGPWSQSDAITGPPRRQGLVFRDLRELLWASIDTTTIRATWINSRWRSRSAAEGVKILVAIADVDRRRPPGFDDRRSRSHQNTHSVKTVR